MLTQSSCEVVSRSPPCCMSASSSCGASCLRLPEPDSPGCGRRKTEASVGGSQGLNPGPSVMKRVLTTGHEATLSRLIIYHPRKFLTWALRSGECLKFQSRPHCPNCVILHHLLHRIFSYFSPLETTLRARVRAGEIASGIPDFETL